MEVDHLAVGLASSDQDLSRVLGVKLLQFQAHILSDQFHQFLPRQFNLQVICFLLWQTLIRNLSELRVGIVSDCIYYVGWDIEVLDQEFCVFVAS